MDPLTASAIISSGVSLGSSLFGNSQAKKQQQREFEQNYFLQLQSQAYNTKERIASQDYNTLMWEKANEYNSPLAQLQRGLDAGINPNVLFGSGVDGSTTSPVTTSPQSSGISSAPSISSALINTNLAESFNLLANAGLADAQKDKVKQDTKFDADTYKSRVRIYEQQADQIYHSVEGLKIDNDQKRVMMRYFAEKEETQLNILKEQLNELRNNVILSSEKIDTENLTQDSISASTDKTKQETSNLKIQGKILDEQFEQESVKTAFSKETGVPLGTSEFEIHYALWKAGKWSDLADLQSSTLDGLDVGQTISIAYNAGKAGIKHVKDSEVAEDDNGDFKYTSRDKSIKSYIAEKFVEFLLR